MAVRYRRLFGVAGAFGVVALIAAVSMQSHVAAQVGIAKADTESSTLGGRFDHEVIPVLTTYCYTCHNSQKPAGGLALDKLSTMDSIVEKRDVWDQASKYIRTHQMPPDGNPQPSDEQRTKVSSFVDGQLFAYYTAHPDPGRVTIHRLNRSEYNHTIQDLLGVDFEPAADFPDDDSGYGFDNIGDVLSLSPILMEKYLAAAEKALDLAIPTEPPVSKVRHFAAAQTEVGFNALGDRGDGWVQLISLEEDDVAVELPVQAGDYLFRVKAFVKPTGGSVVGGGSNVPVIPKGVPDPTYLGVFVGSTFCTDLKIDATEDAPKVYEARIGVAAGKQRFRAAVRRNRGGANELAMTNGRIGKQQPGIVFVKCLEIEGPLPAAVERYPARKLEVVGQQALNSQGGRTLEAKSEVATTLQIPKTGEYVLRAQAYAHQAGSDAVKMDFAINGQQIHSFDVIAPATLLPLPQQNLFDINLLNARPFVYETKATLPAGKVRFSAGFANGFDDPANSNPNLRHRDLTIDYLEVVNPHAPLPTPPMSQTMAAYFSSDAAGRTDAAAQHIFKTFGRRAFRRPMTDNEMQRCGDLFKMARSDGETFESSVKLALKAILVSPHFLFRGELQPEPDNPKSAHEVEECALASRLSYFLWSSAPDDELLNLANRHQLRAHLPEQVKRMLASPKSAALSENFAGQWFQLRNMPNLAPDKESFHEFDDSLRAAMQRETEMLFRNIMTEDRSVLEILTADYTFVNGRLARFYGLDNVTGEEFQKVSLAGTHREGVLTQGSILTLTSNPTRTSPVKRGKFVLENLLGTPPPPPPPDVPKLDEEAKHVTGTLRHQMELHRQNAVCASCHAQMDPIGFGLENFDAIGKWRNQDGGLPIDAAGQLKTGERFNDVSELINILITKRRDDYLHCLAEKMLTYALGRGIEAYDRPAVERIFQGMQSNECRFSALVTGIIDSMPFQMERGEDDNAGL